MRDNRKPLPPISGHAALLPSQPEALTTHQLKLLRGAELIAGLDPGGGTKVFLPRFLVQCTLPHQDPGDIPVWQRHNNDYTLTLQPGWDTLNHRTFGYPYGLLPRLVLIWMVTEAKRTNSRRLELGKSLTNFLAQLDLSTRERSKRSDATRLKEQMRRLLNCRVIFHKRVHRNTAENGQMQTLEGERVSTREVAASYELFWEARSDSQSLFESYVELSSDFFAAIMESVVPFSLEAVAMLRRSTLSLDLYILAVYLGYYLTLKGQKKHVLTWRMLNQQLGSNYGDLDDLRVSVRKILPRVKAAHPGLRIRLKVGNTKNPGGLEIFASAPAIYPRAPKTEAH